MARLEPLRRETLEGLDDIFQPTDDVSGFTPNSLLTMARKPGIARALIGLSKSIFQEANEVPVTLKALVAQVASRAAGCQYCWSHTGSAGISLGLDEEKVASAFDFERSPLFSEAERAALRVAAAGGVTPNAVTDQDFIELKKHFTEGQIVEIVSVIAFFGFMNRWNDTFATEIEAKPQEVGGRVLAAGGWTGYGDDQLKR